MNKNAVYLAIFAALCVLAGVLVGAGLAKRPNFPGHGLERPNFAERAERFIGYGPKEHGLRAGGGGPVEILAANLNLSAEQKEKVAQILDNARQKIDETGRSVRSTIAKIKEETDKQIMDILTPGQQEKFKAMQKDSERQHGPRGPRGERGPEGERGPRPGPGPGEGEELPPPPPQD